MWWTTAYLCVVVGERPKRVERLHKRSMDRIVAFGLAIHIPVILWFGSSYLIARSVFSLAVRDALIVASISGFLIYLVERLVIATPRSAFMTSVRVALALIVAFLGAAAVDLVIFEKEIANSLAAIAKSELEKRYDDQIKAQRDVVDRRSERWQLADDAAQCEANGTCGSKRANKGPIYQAAKQRAEVLRGDLKEAETELVRLRSEWSTKIQEIETTDKSLVSAGLLTRLQALHEYINQHWMAFAAWALLLGFMILMELLVVIVKFGFKETVDDKLDLIREQASEAKGIAYLEAIKSPVASANRLLASAYH